MSLPFSLFVFIITLMFKNIISAKNTAEILRCARIAITLDLYSYVINKIQKEAAGILDNVILG